MADVDTFDDDEPGFSLFEMMMTHWLNNDSEPLLFEDDFEGCHQLAFAPQWVDEVLEVGARERMGDEVMEQPAPKRRRTDSV